MPIHPASLSDAELLASCIVERTKRGGPGGQHRNKTESAIVVTHQDSGVSGQASERRSQHDNRAVAITRLRLNLALAVRTEVGVSDPSVLPSELWRGRIRGGKLSVSTGHEDFPVLLAEAIDWVAAFDYDLPAAAKRLGLSTSQLIKFLKCSPEAWQMIQSQRVKHGLPRLK
jgi:hypothetical protein